MKPGPRDTSYPVLITGRELREIQAFTWAMGDAFGLDYTIQNYDGQEPLLLYKWDIECLYEITAEALDDRIRYPTLGGPGYMAMVTLARRMSKLKDRAFR